MGGFFLFPWRRMARDLYASYNALALLAEHRHSLFGFLASLTHLLFRLFHVVFLAFRPRLPARRLTLPRARVVPSVLWVLSSALLPGFSGPLSSVLFADLTRSAPSPLRVLLSQLGFMAPLVLSGSRAVAPPGVRRVASSYPVRLQYALVLFRILGLAFSSLLAPRRAPI